MKEKYISVSDSDLQELLLAGECYRRAIFFDTNGRYRSWERCYCAFSAYRDKCDEETLEFLTLHLAGYLASWGMYRGSSFLLREKDYLIHLPVVKLLLDSAWKDLWHPSAEVLGQEKSACQVEELGKKIAQIYCRLADRKEVSTILVTKIMLGTLGCSPAYDTNFSNAARRLKCKVGSFSAMSLMAWANFYCVHRDAFEPFRISCCHDGIEYPPMKVLDMCLFSAGGGEP